MPALRKDRQGSVRSEDREIARLGATVSVGEMSLAIGEAAPVRAAAYGLNRDLAQQPEA